MDRLSQSLGKLARGPDGSLQIDVKTAGTWLHRLECKCTRGGKGFFKDDHDADEQLRDRKERFVPSAWAILQYCPQYKAFDLSLDCDRKLVEKMEVNVSLNLIIIMIF